MKTTTLIKIDNTLKYVAFSALGVASAIALFGVFAIPYTMLFDVDFISFNQWLALAIIALGMCLIANIMAFIAAILKNMD